MVISNFVFARIPEIHFGIGEIKNLPNLINKKGKRLLLVTGSSSFKATLYYKELITKLKELAITTFEISVSGEPSPTFIDKVTKEFRKENIEVVAAIGGGSVIDAGKAISAMLPQEGSVLQYLEGMETAKHNGIKVPYIAVPTSSGTGAEATKNAVLSEVGENGFKKSLRHDNFVPDVALLDPELTLSCPKNVTAACGLDALTQLLEAYVSTAASPMTDALAFSGLEYFKNGFLSSFLNGEKDITARSNMCYASLISGIVLANAGLGAVHGFASPIGGYFNIPHGVVCGTLLASSTEKNILELLKDEKKNEKALDKYAKVGVLLSSKASTTLKNDCNLLIDVLKHLIDETNIPRLSSFGISKSDISKIVSNTSNKNNPIKLSGEQLEEILVSRL